MISTLTLCAGLALAAAPGRKTPAPPPGKSHLDVGLSAFAEGEFDLAIRHLDQAAARAVGDADLARVHLARGQCFAALQDFGKAEAAFARALEHDPESRLDPVRVRPAIVAILDGLRGRMRGELEVRSDPAGAWVDVDGKPAGNTPLATALAIGRHPIRVTSPDSGVQQSFEVVIRVRQSTRIAVSLEATLPPAVVAVAPPVPEKPAAGRPEPTELEASVAAGEGLRPFADARAVIDPAAGVGFEIGGGVAGRFLAASVHAVIAGALGVTVRGAVRAPDLLPRLSAYASLDVPAFFTQPLALGLGASAGAEVALVAGVEVFAAVGGRHFFTLPPRAPADYLVIEAGVRVRAPGHRPPAPPVPSGNGDGG